MVIGLWGIEVEEEAIFGAGDAGAFWLRRRGAEFCGVEGIGPRGMWGRREIASGVYGGLGIGDTFEYGYPIFGRAFYVALRRSYDGVLCRFDCGGLRGGVECEEQEDE